VEGFIWLKKGSGNGALKNLRVPQKRWEHKDHKNDSAPKSLSLRQLAQSQKGPNSFIMTVCISAANNGRISLKFDMGEQIKARPTRCNK